MKNLIFLVLVIGFDTVVLAGQPFFVRSARSCVQQVCVQQQQAVVQAAPVFHQAAPIVNTVVGVPVPVLYNAPIAQQGSTVYGYVQPGLSYTAPNTVDLALLYNQANRLTEQAQQLAAQANSDFQALVKLEAQNQQQRYQTQGNFQIILKVENGQVSVQEPYKLITPQQSECPSAVCEPPAMPPAASAQAMPSQASSVLSLDSIVQNKCYQCHNAKNSKGGLSFDVPIGADMQQSILERITTTDPSLSMPRNADGSVAKRLDKAELDIFYQAMGVKR